MNVGYSDFTSMPNIYPLYLSYTLTRGNAMQFSVVISRFTQPHSTAANYNITGYCNFFSIFLAHICFSIYFFFRIEFFKETITSINCLEITKRTYDKRVINISKFNKNSKLFFQKRLFNYP